jgi:nitrogen fixation/metabolism regulation signal transduction histidine kinase
MARGGGRQIAPGALTPLAAASYSGAATPIVEGTCARGDGTIPRFRTLETRLLASFLLLASVPALLLSIFATRRISDALDALQNPGVEESVTHGPRLYTELVDRWRTTAEPLLAALPERFPDPETESVIRRLLAESSLTFAIWEDAAPQEAVAAAEPVAPPGPAATPEPAAPPEAAGASELVSLIAVGEAPAADLPDAADWRLLHGDGAPLTLRGRTLRFFHPSGRAVGVVLEADLARAMESVGRDYARYLQLERYEEIQKRLVWLSSAGIFLLAAGAATWVARITARRISRPVHELAHAADRVAAGELSHRAEIRAEGEIGDLVSAFNRMTGQLERSRDELLRMERIAAWRDVARRIAHEIRNPLTPVKVAVHRLRSRIPEGDEPAQECLRSIGEEVESLARISEAFSEFAAMPEARFAPCDLAQVARGVVELFQGATPGVRVEYEGPESLPLTADRDHLRRAATNLVKNAGEAIRGAGRPGVVRVRVAVPGTRALLEVCDDGPGVPEEIRGSLFRPGVSRRPGGSGLGLAMVQRIATDHRGALRWSDRNPGTCFQLEIPLDLREGG